MSKMLMSLGACALTFAPLPALAAAPEAGPGYAVDQIRAFGVAGVNLGMAAEEARNALIAQGYEGRYRKFEGTERNAATWVKVDQTAVPFRFMAKDGQVRVWDVMFEQRFDRPQSIETLRAMVVRKYGPPSEIDTSNVNNPYQMKYYVAFTVNHADLDICSSGGMAALCPDAERDAMFREVAMPILTVSLTPTAMPVGTPIQMLTISREDRPTISFGHSATVVTDASILSPPCHGTLVMTRPLGFRYVPASDFAGRDMYAVRGCNGMGQCSITGAVIDVRPR